MVNHMQAYQEFYDNQSLQELNENFKISIDKPVGIKKFFGKQNN